MNETVEKAIARERAREVRAVRKQFGDEAEEIVALVLAGWSVEAAIRRSSGL